MTLAEAEKYRGIIQSIKDKALDICPDYPGIETCEPWEQLYAIHSSYQGCSMANDDLHKVIDILRVKLGMSVDELLELSKKVHNESRNTLQA